MSNQKKTAAEYIVTVYGTANFARMLIADDGSGVMQLMQDFSDHNVKASLPDTEQIHYNGKGNHSVWELETIARAYAELCHQININR